MNQNLQNESKQNQYLIIQSLLRLKPITNKDMDSTLISPIKKFQASVIPKSKSNLNSNKQIDSLHNEQNNQENLDQILKIQISIKYVQEKMTELENKMIIQMKRIGDNQESFLYKRMVKEGRQLKKQLNQLKVKQEILLKVNKINPQEQKQDDKKSIKSRSIVNSSRAYSSNKKEKPDDFDNQSIRSRRKSMYSEQESIKSKQTIKESNLQGKQLGLARSKLSRKQTIESLKAQLIKSQVLVNQGIQLLKKNSSPPIIYDPYPIYKDPFFDPLFYSTVLSSRWI